MPGNKPINIFISYSNNAKDRNLLLESKKYLKSSPKGELTIWDDGLIIPGKPWDKSIEDKLLNAHLDGDNQANKEHSSRDTSKTFYGSEYDILNYYADRYIILKISGIGTSNEVFERICVIIETSQR